MMTVTTSEDPNRKWRIAHTEASAGWGGQEHRVLAELTGFQKRGCSVWLLAPKESKIFERALQAGIPAESVDFSKLRFPLNIIKFAHWLRRNRIQVLNPHSSRDGWLFGIAGRLAGVPLIIRTRHIDVDYPNPRVSRHAFTTLADHVLTTSDKIANHFQEVFHLNDDRVTTLSTGIDLERFAPEGPEADLGTTQQPGVPLIGMVSVLRSWKGHLTFLEAARILKESGFSARYLIVGAGPGRNKILQQIEAMQLQEMVSLPGHREDIPELLRVLSALVIPSTGHEGVPQIGLQALATKTPVIGSDVGGIPEIIQPGETGRIFPAGNAGALALAIRETIEQTELTRAMAERGFASVHAGHSLESMLDRLDALYSRHIPEGS
jgi:glycosyltransferase involved in cell wall biosynthesis